MKDANGGPRRRAPEVDGPHRPGLLLRRRRAQPRVARARARPASSASSATWRHRPTRGWSRPSTPVTSPAPRLAEHRASLPAVRGRDDPRPGRDHGQGRALQTAQSGVLAPAGTDARLPLVDPLRPTIEYGRGSRTATSAGQTARLL